MVHAQPLMRRGPAGLSLERSATTVTTSASASVPTQTSAPDWKLTHEDSDGLTARYRLTDVAGSGVSSVAVRVVGCLLPTGEDVAQVSDGTTIVTVVHRRPGASNLRPTITVAWMDRDGRFASWHSELP